jgi:K(+)-stimulated pyrophosphate-energized sodium pump
MLPATMKMEFFGKECQDISSMRVFYATIVGLVVGAVISSVTGLGTKCYGYRAKIKYGSRNKRVPATGMISTFPTVLLFAAAFGFTYALAGFTVWLRRQ